MAVIAYSHNLSNSKIQFYKSLNEVLRTKRITANYKEWNEGMQPLKQYALPYLYLLYSACSKLPRCSPGQPLFRGVPCVTQVPEVMQPLNVQGEEFGWAQISSSSTVEDVALDFALGSERNLVNGLVFYVEPQQGGSSSARDIHMLSAFPYEQERIFPIDMLFIVRERAVEIENHTAVYVDEKHIDEFDFFDIFDFPAYKKFAARTSTTTNGTHCSPHSNVLPYTADHAATQAVVVRTEDEREAEGGSNVVNAEEGGRTESMPYLEIGQERSPPPPLSLSLLSFFNFSLFF